MANPKNITDYRVSVFCAPEKDAYRIYLWPNQMPAALRDLFDAHFEAYPVQFDISNLDRLMGSSGGKYEKRDCGSGAYELTATGAAAPVLAQWLVNVIASSNNQTTDLN